jgi:hypothetical protein
METVHVWRVRLSVMGHVPIPVSICGIAASAEMSATWERTASTERARALEV